MSSIFVTQAKKQGLKLKIAFLEAYNHWEGCNFLTGEPMQEGKMVSSNFPHVLAKGQNQYPWFAFYKRNIVLMTPEQHAAYDAGSDFNSAVMKRINCGFETRKDWQYLYDYRDRMIMEYKEWISDPCNFRMYKT